MSENARAFRSEAHASDAGIESSACRPPGFEKLFERGPDALMIDMDDGGLGIGKERCEHETAKVLRQRDFVMAIAR